MNLYINTSKATHILSKGTSPFPIAVSPNEIFDRSETDIPIEQFTWFKKCDFGEFVNLDEIGFIREYALGDLIQLVPVARMYKRLNKIKTVHIMTSGRYKQALSDLFPDLSFYDMSIKAYKKFIKIHMNGILENDHSLENEHRNLHRLNIYADFLGMNMKNEKIEWGHKMNGKRNILFDKSDKVIAVQIRGSGFMKTLPYEFVQKIVKLIVAMGYKALLIDQDKTLGMVGDNIIDGCGKMDVVDIVSNLEMCKCVLTMDSGVLWLAHVANCPVLTFLGSTREHERMSLHPQYPEKARSINLSEHVGCTPCFETRVRCKGKIDCMNKFDHDTILKKVQENLEIILKGV